MRPHRGGGRVVAHARGSLGGQVIGTGIRHDLPLSAVVGVARRVVETTFSTPLMARLRLAHRCSLAAFAAVDMAAVVGLAEVEDPRAPRAANPHKNIDTIHAPAETAALANLPARAPSGTFALSASTRDTKARGTTPGPSSFRGQNHRLRDALSPGQFPTDTWMHRFLRI
jgi:hypothetical protein